MDYATKMAFRAVIIGLRDAKKIDEADVENIVEELRIAAAGAHSVCLKPERDMLRELASDLDRDCCPSSHVQTSAPAGEHRPSA